MSPGLSCPKQLGDTHPSRGLQDQGQGSRCSVCSPAAGFGVWTRWGWRGEGELQAQQGWALTAGYGRAPSAPMVCTEPHTEEMKVQPKISPPRPPCCSTALLLPSAFLPVVQHVGAEPPSAHSPGGAGHGLALSQGTRGHRRAWQRLHWPFLTAGTHRHLLSPEPNSSPEGAAGQRVQGGGELR